MDEIIYSALTQYYGTLGRTGYYRYSDALSLLVLIFYRDFVFHDYKGLLSREDYGYIERALNCLFGKNCLIPYPDYLKMGKLHIGEMSEIATRLRNIENTDVLKSMEADESMESDIIITTTEEE